MAFFIEEPAIEFEGETLDVSNSFWNRETNSNEVASPGNSKINGNAGYDEQAKCISLYASAANAYISTITDHYYRYTAKCRLGGRLWRELDDLM
jgi:hypothetical protein